MSDNDFAAADAYNLWLLGPDKTKRKGEAANHARCYLALRKAQEWQPIESAPRDGTEIVVGKYYGEQWHANTAAWMPEGANGPGWITPDCCEVIRPTHWMPLPTPPENANG